MHCTFMQSLKTKQHNLPMKLSLQSELESDIQADSIHSRVAKGM